MAEDPRISACLRQVEELAHTVDSYKSQTDQLKSQVAALTAVVEVQRQQIAELSAGSSGAQDVLGLSNCDPTESFNEFMRCNRKAQARLNAQKQEAKLKELKEIFSYMKSLTAIGKKNEHIFACINLYIELLQEIKPTTEGWTWTQWWFSTQQVTLVDIKQSLIMRLETEENQEIVACLTTIQNIVDEILEEQKIHAETESSWSLYRESADSDVDQVKEKLNEALDKSGFEICRKLENTIRHLGDDPAQFIEDHCAALLDSVTEEQKEKVKEFAEAFALHDWVLVNEDNTPEEEVDFITATLRKVRQSCSIYGYNSSVDHAINTAGEYKATCARLKNTIEWVYFGGRLAVDPTGAMLSLLW